MANDVIWQVKVAARIHDPAEKALVLLRDPAGHEGGTSAALARLLGQLEIQSDRIAGDRQDALSNKVFRDGIPSDIYRMLQRADWWAAAADRPQWPLQQFTVTSAQGEKKTFAVADWAQVRWHAQPVLIHPLSGHEYRLPGGLSGTDLDDIKHRSFSHFADLIERCGLGEPGSVDWRRLALALWRFGPELVEERGHGKLGELWKLLPADTRVPDHTIWDHLDLVSAFAGAFAASRESQAALLVFSIGPVQSFIQAARKTEDLWAGSHLLARMTWEAARPLCEELGPDAVVYPRLRGIAQVDLWLRDRMGLPAEFFARCAWRNRPPDANPLFAAALPNRFVAIVPADRVRELAEKCSQSVRKWTLELGLRVVDRLLEVAGAKLPEAARDDSVPAYQQMREQLRNFPEVHWAAASFALCPPRDPLKQRDPDIEPLKKAMAPFYGVDEGEHAGFLATSAWKILSKELDLPDGAVFYAPNPGVLYPAVFELTERLLAAAKSVRPFEQSRQEGWRCTLSGECEWLTTDRTHLAVPRGRRKSSESEGFDSNLHVETLWAKIAHRRPALAKDGEHLSALPAIKRLWPELFAEEVKEETGGITDRFVVSTHTMALAAQLERWLESAREGKAMPAELREWLGQRDIGDVALPRRIVNKYNKHPLLPIARKVPAALDAARDSEDENRYTQAGRWVRRLLAREEGEAKQSRIETYYGLLLMDGDRMGAILSGEAATAITFLQSFHPQVREAFEIPQWKSVLEPYARQSRPVSPNRHMAISSALNDFSQIVVPHIVEEEHAGRVIYAGGDDVLAMLPVAQVLRAAARLRGAYSGSYADDEQRDWEALRNQKASQLICKGGFAWLNGRLMRMMGPRATASCGVVIAHHQAPLSFVLRELREAEGAAKRYRRPVDGRPGSLKDRDAIHIVVIKRSGGKLEVSLDWGEPLRLLEQLRDFLADPDVSRRAVFLALDWLDHVPETNGRPDAAMLEAMLAYQLKRQSGGEAAKKASELAARLAGEALRRPSPKQWLTHFLCVADFLAREQRQVREGGAE